MVGGMEVIFMDLLDWKEIRKWYILDNTIQMNLFEYFIDSEQFSIQEATNLVRNVKNMNVNNESIRARIYEGVDRGIFQKITRGVYKVTKQLENTESTCLLINGDGRNLSMIKNILLMVLLQIILMICRKLLLVEIGSLLLLSFLDMKAKTLKKNNEC